MSDVFKSYFNDAATCDVTVIADDIKISAHKVVLVAQSALFRAMFQVRPTSCRICNTKLHANCLIPAFDVSYTLQSGTRRIYRRR